MMLPLLFMSNRQKKMQQKQAELVKQLGVGDEVRTHSGFYGLIIDSYDDVVILESENGAQTKWARQAISQAVDPIDEVEGSEQELDSDLEREGGIPGVTVSEDDGSWRGPAPRRALSSADLVPGVRSRAAHLITARPPSSRNYAPCPHVALPSRPSRC